MRPAVSAGLIATVVALAGCGGRAVKIDPNAEPVAGRWNAVLATPAGLAGAIQVQGSGWMEHDPKDSSQTKAHAEITNAAPGGAHPWHVHRGQCGNDMGVLGPADAYPLLKVGDDGKAQRGGRPSHPDAAGRPVFRQRPRVGAEHGDDRGVREPRAARSLR